MEASFGSSELEVIRNAGALRFPPAALLDEVVSQPADDQLSGLKGCCHGGLFNVVMDAWQLAVRNDWIP
jgi:hypothetical protein